MVQATNEDNSHQWLGSDDLSGHDALTSFGGPADRAALHQRMSRSTVISQVNVNTENGVTVVDSGVTAGAQTPEVSVSWTCDDMKDAQKTDKEIGPIFSCAK